ncbi:hypothetical protein [Bosea beijingensis]
MKVLSFPTSAAVRVNQLKADRVMVCFDLGRWSAATYAGERLKRRFPASSNTSEAAAALAREIAERDGLNFIESRRG